MSNKLLFTGHDTFYCRQFWLKKGYDQIVDNQLFDNDAVVGMGVGRNMVNSIKFWLKAFCITDEEGELTMIGQDIFDDDGFDPYLEDKGTLWLLHFYLVTTGKSSIYSLVFNYFRRERMEFEVSHLAKYIDKICKERSEKQNATSIKKDINVFFNNYLPNRKNKGIEDSHLGILQDLNLVRRIDNSKEWHKIADDTKEELPALIVLFCILEKKGENTTVEFKNLLNNTNSVGRVFALTEKGLMDKINTFIDYYPDELVFKNDGGIATLQFKKEIEPLNILKRYYAS